MVSWLARIIKSLSGTFGSYQSTAEFGNSVRGLGKSNLELKDFEKAFGYFQEALRDSRGSNQSQLQTGYFRSILSNG